MNYLLTNPQRSIWFTEKVFSGTAINNISGYTYIDEDVDLNVLKKAINEVIKLNDSMRIKIIENTDSCNQFFSEYKPFDIDVLELSSEQDIEKRALLLAKIPFEINNNLLFKFNLFILPNNHGGFFLSAHHIIGDSWSLGIIVKDILKIYSDMKSKTYIPKCSPSYLNYIKNEQEYISSNKYLKDKNYWNEVFETVPEVATIPSTKNNKTHSAKSDRKKFIIPQKDLEKIKEFCIKNKISIYNFFMSIYSIYLGRVSNLDDFVIGTPILNRTNLEQKHTTGMFISTAPLRIKLNNNVTFIEFVKQVSSNTISLFRHQRYSYQNIIEDLRKKDSSLPNLYNVVLSYQITKTVYEENNIKYFAEWLTNGNCADDIQIHLFDINDQGAITVAYEYKTDKYDNEDISCLHSRILTIIHQVINNNNLLLKNIEIITPEEKHEILYKFNNTKLAYPKEKTVLDLFEEQVEKKPDNIAVVYKDKQLTYKELNEKANQLARYLKNKGVVKNSVVGICLKKSIDFLISVYATLKCGAIYMPIFSDYPKDRINYMIKNSNCSTIITTKNNFSKFENIIPIDIENVEYDSFLKDNLYIKASNSDVAYIIYTSGSTGTPKGVQITQQNLVNFIFAFKKYYKGIDYKDTFLSSTNISFDVCIWELFTPLSNGAKLVFNTTDIITDIVLFCNNIIKNNITALYIPPNILNEVYSLLRQANYTKISKLLVGVEPISNITLNKYIDLNPNIIIINGYGPTETTICATAFEYKKDITDAHTVSIGRPLLNNKIYILSKGLLCPIGVPGELFVSGDGVGSGYLNDDKKNSVSFVQDIFDSNKKMYSTGDIAYWNKNGTLNFVGRRDKQIKLHGYRIELSEIDSVLEKYPIIIKSFSIVSNEKIISYYISSEPITTETIKLYLKDKLPFYMIPSFFINIDKFPVTINGKINVEALPAPTYIKNNYIKPRNETEKNLCLIWCKLFNKDKISITDNFFELGGDSLVAIRLQTEALKYNLDINYGDIFSSPTIELLAKKDLNKKSIFTTNNNSFKEIEDLISINVEQNIPNTILNIKESGFLLLGATGFLGAHILDSIIKNTSSKVYCIIREKNGISAQERLENILSFYFGDKYYSSFKDRIFVFTGDISKSNLGLDNTILNLLNKEISIVINSAAHVKHYGKYEQFTTSNIDGTKNIIDFCLKFNKKLYHISTISISGTTSIDFSITEREFLEKDFFINQDLNNAYIYTKFQSELSVLNSIKNDGLNATILRLGNIFNRYSDGKFQINFADNSYLNRLRSFINIGYLPDILKKHAIDFSPVDFCAEAIIKIAMTKHNFTIFHLFNTNLIGFVDIINLLKKLGYDINFTNNNDFKKKINTLINDPNYSDKISGIIPDLDKNMNLKLIFGVVPKADFTNTYLNKIGFIWPNIDLYYFKCFIDYFKNIGYLN